MGILPEMFLVGLTGKGPDLVLVTGANQGKSVWEAAAIEAGLTPVLAAVHEVNNFKIAEVYPATIRGMKFVPKGPGQRLYVK